MTDGVIVFWEKIRYNRCKKIKFAELSDSVYMKGNIGK